MSSSNPFGSYRISHSAQPTWSYRTVDFQPYYFATVCPTWEQAMAVAPTRKGRARIRRTQRGSWLVTWPPA